MDHQFCARLALSAFCCIQGISQLIIDLNRTHASNPSWTPHARFHVVWQSVTVALLSLGGVYLIWTNSLPQGAGFYLAILVACASPIGFLAALVTRRVYGGGLSDSSGIHPAKLNMLGKTYLIDLNLAAVLFGFAVLITILVMYKV